MKLRVAFAAGAWMLALSTAGLAETTDTQEARIAIAGKLISETITAGLVQNMTETVWPAFEGSLKEKNRDISAEVLTGLKSDLAEMQKNLFAELIVDMPGIYAQHFTVAELEAIYAFQTSDVGRKAVAVQPQIMGQIMPKLMKSIEANMPLLMERFRQRAMEKGLEL
jgi:hypothetical protein